MHAAAEEAALADAVRDAHDRNEPVLIEGAGTKLCMVRPVQAARTISTRALTGVTLYAPKELVMSARSGTPLSEIEATLAGEGQHLIAEPPDYAPLLSTAPGTQTLGGIVATNFSGPRRVMAGAVRDHVLGMRVVDGTGAVMRAGGRVLKNVTGLDICKLVTGSHGTLGVMTEITLKVLPAPEATGSVVLSGLDAVRGVAALSAALGSPFGVSGAAFLPADAAARLGRRESITLVRIEDFATSVTYRLARLRGIWTKIADVDVLDDAASREAWLAIRDAAVLPAGEDEAIWRISTRPKNGPAILEAAIAAGGRGYLDWGGGLAMVAAPATEAAHALLTQAATKAGGVWMLLRAPEPMRAAVHVVPPEAPALARLSRRVKSVMDPEGILNPGRLFAGV